MAEHLNERTWLQDTLAVDHPEYMRIILLARRVRELERQRENATIALDEASLARNQISESLLGILQDLRQAPSSAPLPDHSVKQAETQAPPPPKPASAGPDGPAGFFGELDYSGAPCMKEQTIVLEKPYTAAYAASLAALGAVGLPVGYDNQAAGRIEATIPGNMITSFGEKALLWLTPIGNDRTRVHVVVDSVLPTMVLDWGRCKNKLAAILSNLR